MQLRQSLPRYSQGVLAGNEESFKARRGRKIFDFSLIYIYSLIYVVGFYDVFFFNKAFIISHMAYGSKLD